MIVGWEWMWQRTHRLAMLLYQPNILAGALQIVEALDRHVAAKNVPEHHVTLGDAKFIRGLDYVEYPLTEA